MITREKERKQEQQNAKQAIVSNKYKGLLNFAPRVGKTAIAIDAIDSLIEILKNAKILWVTPESDLRDVHTPNEFRKFDKEHLLQFTKFICYGSLKNETGYYDLIIFDEYQYLTIKNSTNLFNKSLASERMLGLSATPPKHSDKLYMLGLLGLKEIAKLSIDDAADKGIINDYRINIMYYLLDDQDKYIKNSTYYVTEYKKYEYLTKSIDNQKKQGLSSKFLSYARAKIIYGSKSKLQTSLRLAKQLTSFRGMIFLPYKAQVEQFDSFYHSTSGAKHYTNFNKEKINHLALIKAGGVGHTYKNIDYVIIGQITKDFAGITTQSWARGLTFRPGKPLDVYILCAKDTIEEVWLKETLINVDQTKINYI